MGALHFGAVESEAPAATERFEALVTKLGGLPGVTVGTGRRGFGSDALCVDGRVFAMVSRDRLVMKLPADTVTSLVAVGEGTPFDAGKGRPMREWVVLVRGGSSRCAELAEEAIAFVGGRG